MNKGLIRREDVQLVRERARIEEIVSEHVTLRSGGLGSMKGLCPFHDEKTPSFTIRPAVGRYHCFGCGEDGDVISFVQKMQHLSFAEAVEYLAGRYSVQLRYEDASGNPGSSQGPRSDFGSRQRLYAAHEVAEEFFREQLLTPGAEAGRRFLGERGFTRASADTFGVGFAPQGWDALLRHLRGRGFTEKELADGGLVSTGQRGVYDRFRGRLVWPIRDVTGKTIGFGARKLFEDDQGPKYLNTPESPIYKKSQVLYGLDVARKAISSARQVVVMEGYTDVMAAHEAGITTAVASCGTAFGSEHVTVVRRIMGDTSAMSAMRLGGAPGSSLASVGGEVIFTFDGDAAGQKAALKAFGEDQRFVAQTFVAVDPEGQDPCDIRLHRGDQALRDVVERRIPMFEFAIRSALAQVNLDTAEGQVAGLRMAAPVVAQIRDRALRPEYARRLSGWLGLDERTVARAVQDAGRQIAQAQHEQPRERPGEAPGAPGAGQAGAEADAGNGGEAGPELVMQPIRLSDITQPRDPVVQVEVQSLALMLQAPAAFSQGAIDAIPDDAFRTPVLQSVWDCILASGMLDGAGADGVSPRVFVETVLEIAGETVCPLVAELASTPLPVRTEADTRALAASLMSRLSELSLTHEYSELRRKLGRLNPVTDPDDYQQVMARLAEIQVRRRALTAEA